MARTNKRIRMISVVIPLYNKEKQIQQTLKSVLTQSLQDFEIVIVNDGSTDKSHEIISSLNNPKITVITTPNKGVSSARNTGIKAAKFDWIATLDADDEWHNDYLKEQWQLHLKYPECDVCACNYQINCNEGSIIPAKINGLKFEGEDGILTNYFQVATHSHPPICSISIMAKKSAFTHAGGFEEGVNSGEDLLMWARLACKNKIAYCKKVLATYNDAASNNSPKRTLTKHDRVGDALFELYNNQPSRHLRAYLSHYHKMRCYIFMLQDERKLAFSEGLISLKFNPANYKVFAYFALIILGSKTRNFMLKKLR